MKIFSKLMLAIALILGVAACTDGSVNIFGDSTEGFAFVASIDHTRADMVNNDGIWRTVWSGDDKLLVTSDKGEFTFTNSAEKPSLFVSTDVEAEALRDATNIVITTLHENGSTVDSDAGKRGLSLRQEYERFPENSKVSLGVQSAFFRLACDYDVTLTADAAIFSGINASNALETNISLKAGDDIWVALNPCVEKTSLTVTVEEENVLVVEEVALKPCVIYNLGKIVPETTEPEQDSEPSSWAVSGSYNGWSSDDVMYTTAIENLFVRNSLTFQAGDKFKIKSVGSWDKDYGSSVTNLMPNVWITGVYKGSSITVANSGTYDIYFDSVYELIYLMEEGVDYTSAIEQTNKPTDVSWGLCGTHNDWGRDGNKDYELTWDQTIGLYVAYDVTLTGEFKVRADNTWGNDYGSNCELIVDDDWSTIMGKSGGNCICEPGNFDVYFYVYPANGALIWVRTPGSEAPTLW